MGLFSWLFGKKNKTKERNDVTSVMKGYFDLYDDKKSSDDGQAQYFKDESASGVNASAEKAETASAQKASEKKEKAIKAAKSALDEGAAKPDASEKSAKSEKAEKPEAAEKSAKAEKPASAEKPKTKARAQSGAKSSDQNETNITTEKEKKTMKKTGTFEIKKTKDGRFIFNLIALNNVTVASSQTYSSSQSAINGIESIIANAAKAPIEDQTVKNFTLKTYPKWEIYIDNGGEYRFRLNASNGSCIVHSQGYTTKASCKNGIDSIIRCSGNPEIDKSYLKK